MTEIPLLGLVAAGQPIEAILAHETVSARRTLIGRGRMFALRVRGDSMIERKYSGQRHHYCVVSGDGRERPGSSGTHRWKLCHGEEVLSGTGLHSPGTGKSPVQTDIYQDR